tara:strand:- start:2407 stop:3147 length:741 start_codon:yes stop_codon:yes gene_type:complete
MKVCVCFFGLTRSLRYTIDSINKNILKILEDNNIKYDVYLHTYDLEVLTNKRSNEFNCMLDTEEYKLLNAKEFIIDSQDEFDKNFDYNSVKKFGDYWGDNFSSLKNLIRQLNSLKKVFSLIENKNNEYDSFIFIRPDLKIISKIDIDNILETKNENVIATCNFSKWRGLNDRAAIGNYNSIKKYANRIDNIYEYMNENGKLHAEKLLKFVMEKFKIKNIDLNLYFIRIRANNDMEKKDLYILKLIE